MRLLLIARIAALMEPVSLSLSVSLSLYLHQDAAYKAAHLYLHQAAAVQAARGLTGSSALILMDSTFAVVVVLASSNALCLPKV